MGKSLPTATSKLQHLAKVTAFNAAKKTKPPTQQQPPRRIISEDKSNPRKKMDSSSATQLLPLSKVVSGCVKRWFKDTLRKARNEDIDMQILVGQLYYSCFGVPRDAHKGRLWMIMTSRLRSSVSKVIDKHPGYDASDSDSDEIKGDS